MEIMTGKPLVYITVQRAVHHQIIAALDNPKVTEVECVKMFRLWDDDISMRDALNFIREYRSQYNILRNIAQGKV